MLSRRRFLELCAWVAGGALAGCDDERAAAGEPDAGADAAADAALPPVLDVFDIWRAMQAGIRQSPDHLAARSDALVAAGDPEALLRFVRDAIRLLPDTGDDDQQNTEQRMYWGAAAALRCGAGTARTKAELLATLYRRAGFEEVAVVVGPVDVRGAAAQALFLAGEFPAFEPALDEAELVAWAEALGGGADQALPPDLDGTESAALAEALLAAVPEAWYRRGRVIGTRLREVPLVALTVAGVAKFANPVLPEVAYGEAGTTADPVPAAPAELTPVRIALGCTRSDTGDEIQTLVERSWSPDELVGRQVQVQLVPLLDFDTLARTDLDRIGLFAPCLRVVGPTVDVATGSDLLALGDPITPAGERVRVDPATGGITVEGDPIDVPAADASEALARVAQLSVAISSSQFGRIRVRLRALDVDGVSVRGLTAGAFRVEEDDALRGHLLTASLGKPPRVLFILDVSVSVPQAFRAEGAAALARDVAARVVAQVPEAQFRASSLISGYRLYGNWTSDPEALHEAARGAASTSSDLWSAASQATRENPTLIVMITDGEASDEASDARLRLILNGPPVVGIQVTESESGAAFLNELAGLTHGGYFRVSAPDEAVAAIVGFLDVERTTHYQLRYAAPPEGAEERRVTVSTADLRLTATGTYRVPVPAQRTPPPFLTGLFLTVAASGREVTRPLAGNDGTLRFSGPDDPAVAAELRDQFFGVTTVSFEGGAPTTAAWLDDVLTARLSQEPIFRALAAGDHSLALQHIQTLGLRSPHFELVTAHPPLPRTPEVVTFETGLRVVVLNERPELAAGVFREKMDILPLTGFASVAADGRAGYQATLRHTARRAIWEAARYARSTRSALGDTPLAPWDSGTGLPAFLRDADQGEVWASLVGREGSENRLMPFDGSVYAWWSIHEVFGELRGLLADGSGGGDRAQQIRDEVAAVKKFFDLLKRFYGGRFPSLVGVAVAYAKALAGLYGTAAIVITTLSAAGAEMAVRQEIADLACTVLKEFYPTLPVLAGKVIGVLTGSSVC